MVVIVSLLLSTVVAVVLVVVSHSFYSTVNPQLEWDSLWECSAHSFSSQSTGKVCYYLLIIS